MLKRWWEMNIALDCVVGNVTVWKEHCLVMNFIFCCLILFCCKLSNIKLINHINLKLKLEKQILQGVLETDMILIQLYAILIVDQTVMFLLFMMFHLVTVKMNKFLIKFAGKLIKEIMYNNSNFSFKFYANLNVPGES